MAIVWSAALVLIADQLTKFWVRSTFENEQLMAVVRDFLNITYVSNRGGVFGIFPRQQYLFAILSIATIIAIIHFYRVYAPRLLACRIAVGMILGGAVGNLLDRLALDFRGGVTDWIDCHWGEYHWPAFNIADSAITLGVFILLYLMLLKVEIQPHIKGNAGAPDSL
ncbi:MAG: signal peptidase II [Candidatus Aureabacteria bacterium]|nr:signal peptidase II [Candidatus Auribacterota bacterium]